MLQVTPADLLRMRDALTTLHGGVAAFVNEQGILPSAHSQADNETRTFSRPESVQTVCSQANLFIEVAADQLTAFTKTITEPFETIAPWTCIRALLESAALAAWLLDPRPSVHERVGRSLALRYEGLDQQLKFVRIAAPSDAPAILTRIDEVERDAIGMGFQVVTDRHGKRNGIGQRMPSATVVIRDTLDEEKMYRMLSAVAHGHFWAIHQLGFRRNTSRDKTLSSSGVHLSALEKEVNLPGMAYLTLLSAKAFGRAVWNQCQYYGWNQGRLVTILENAADEMNASKRMRFWK
ncbi:MAG TPA: hypothetical protein VFQ45_16465 [Longimicrobium sp.]|nr:hypothetical protein [Longimicrobium sp.]